MLSRGEGHFLPVAVTTGVESGDRVEIWMACRKAPKSWSMASFCWIRRLR